MALIEPDLLELVEEAEDRLLRHYCEEYQASGVCKDHLRDVRQWCDVCLMAEIIHAIRERR